MLNALSGEAGVSSESPLDCQTPGITPEETTWFAIVEIAEHYGSDFVIRRGCRVFFIVLTPCMYRGASKYDSAVQHDLQVVLNRQPFEVPETPGCLFVIHLTVLITCCRIVWVETVDLSD